MSFISKFTKRDLGFSILTGLITGTIAWRVLEFLRVPEFGFGHAVDCVSNGYQYIAPCVSQPFHLFWIYLVGIIPVLWILGVLLGYLLGQWMEFFNQFGKFVAIGFTNFAVNVGVLNILLARTGHTSGLGYAAIAAVSFVVATLSSYVWNKYWAFRSNSRSGAQFGKFFLITLIAFAVNVAFASIVVNYIHLAFGLDAHAWANVGAIIGSATGLIISFIGFRVLVFK